MRETSRKLLARARELIPSGVNSPVRAWKAVGGEPAFLVRGRGAEVFDADGNAYLDYVGAWGPLVVGHSNPAVLRAISETLRNGTGFGASTPIEIELAAEIVSSVPSIEKVRLVTSGTEATMTALRIARAATGRERIVKFAGCYHGHSDALLVRAGSGAATFGVPDSAGVPAAVSALTSVVEFNDPQALEETLGAGPPVAAIILEPVPANMGVCPPEPGFLTRVMEVARASGALVIFDEVISGFRLARGGAQEIFGLRADLTCLGKIIGGGLPVGAVGGRADLMELLAPSGPVYQAGTLSGSPLACAAGLATLRQLDATSYRHLEEFGSKLELGLKAILRESGRVACVQRVGSLLTVFFGVTRVRRWQDAASADTKAYGQFFLRMIEEGVYLPPSQYEAWFVSLQHGEAELDRTLRAVKAALH